MREINVLELIVNLLDDDDGINDKNMKSIESLLNECVDHADIASSIRKEIDGDLEGRSIFIGEDAAESIRESINLAKTEEKL